MNFPRYTIRDMVRTEHELVTKGLGLSGLYAVAGPSMGSFQGVEWGINYPTFMKGLVLIVPAARSDQHFHAIVDAVEGMITLDPAYKDGKYECLFVDFRRMVPRRRGASCAARGSR